MNITVEFSHQYDYEKPHGPNGVTPYSRVDVELKLGDSVLISRQIIINRNVARSDEAFETERDRQGAVAIADWFERVDRMIDKLESL